MRVDLPTKFKIAERIKSLIVVKNNQRYYADGWGDKRIAEEFGVSHDVVRGVRVQMFQGMVAREPAENPKATISGLKEMVSDINFKVMSLNNKVHSIETEIAQLRRA